VSCGFSDQSHMTRALKKGLGLTPGAMRKHGF
jgi:AraC-like DNA-binding protein